MTTTPCVGLGINCNAMIGNDIAYAAELLRSGQLVAIPTETVYGLAANALNEAAVAHIFEVKNRPYFDPLIVHLPQANLLDQYAADISAQARLLAQAFMPGPLTLLLPKQSVIPDLVTAGSALCAFRVPLHPIAQALLQNLGFPLAAPSANPFGYISPTTAAHVMQQLGDKIPYILDGGPCQVGLESTIVGFEGKQAVVYRKGGLPVEQIEALIGPLQVRPHSASNPLAPGMLQSHYAPRIPLLWGNLEELLAAHAHEQPAILAFRQKKTGLPPEYQEVLSPTGDLAEAARNLFAAMRRLDASGASLILAERLPEQGLGRAINDRLRRAAATRSPE